MERDIEATPSAPLRRWKRGWFSAWSLIDYGRSLAKVCIFAVVMVFSFGLIYLLDMVLGWGLIDYPGSRRSWLTPFFYSIVTLAKLRFGDISPQHWLGEVIVIVEVLLGYVTLALLLSILVNKVARRG
jgi:hypothetical protein